MKLERKHGWLLLGVAVWNVVIWVTFAKNLYQAHGSGEHRPSGYYIAHSVLIVVDLVIGAVLGRLGLKLLRAQDAENAENAEPIEPAARL